MKIVQRFSIGQQQLAMQSYFPKFNYCRGKDGPTWKGYLQPQPQSPKYLVKIIYKIKKSPKVWVLSPEIDYAPHRYSNQALCLYYPKDQSWKPSMLLATSIVPWTAEWLAFYEIWRVTGIWYGDEAPHRPGAKKKAN